MLTKVQQGIIRSIQTEAAEQAKAFLEQEHIELEEEYENDTFGARPNWEPTIFEIPYVGTWQGEAYFVKTDESGEYPLQFVVVVFDDAWEGKESKWSFFERGERMPTKCLK